jgi:lysophospholipase L1-like esterase
LRPTTTRTRTPRRLALAALASLALFELVLRLFVLRDGAFFGRPLPPFGAVNTPEQLVALETLEGTRPRGPSTMRFDVDLGWTTRESGRSADESAHANSRGLRGLREYAPAPPAGARRLLCFGDSFTWGEDVADPDTYPARLERLDPEIEALNFGVGGFGTDQALLRFRLDGREWARGADAVLIGILTENIGRNVNRYRPLWAPFTGLIAAKPRFVILGGELELVPQPYASEQELARDLRSGQVLERIAAHEYWLDRPRVPTGRWLATVRLGAGWFAYRARHEARLWADTAAEPFRVTVAILESFVREAAQAGARRALVLVLPTEAHLSVLRKTSRAAWSTLLDELGRRNVPYLDLAPALAELAARCEVDPGLGALWVGGHLSGLGNELVAREAARALGLGIASAAYGNRSE